MHSISTHKIKFKNKLKTKKAKPKSYLGYFLIPPSACTARKTWVEGPVISKQRPTGHKQQTCIESSPIMMAIDHTENLNC